MAAAATGQHQLPDLPYRYDTLEPFISRQIMELHHKKHHQTYVTALNAAELAYAKASTPRERIGLQAALRFNGGGHINHSLFWKNLAGASSEGKGVGGSLRDGPLKKAIVETFGSLDAFKKEFNTTTAGIQGSGWGWLGLNPSNKRLEIVTTANQDPLLTHVPIIGVDIWEHAFYLQYLNVKADYLNAIWSVINFDEAEKRFLEGTNSKL
ncbi:Superoxide dismutase [Mn], mitochondrial [Sparassis crispa]|uniref:Superoxide dismutase n=1 Tax=Sparassis crispa TaxID=139825 RepID=A0A401H5N4_9APHY|nr:Superoxide dismutase [Mn], mitochondrial [Sparassis crispa]GBE89722.1 Superoxide dismutase [Mn], mitochondrial [Sparassis crispa]